jgi:hypothetical protein
MKKVNNEEKSSKLFKIYDKMDNPEQHPEKQSIADIFLLKVGHPFYRTNFFM